MSSQMMKPECFAISDIHRHVWLASAAEPHELQHLAPTKKPWIYFHNSVTITHSVFTIAISLGNKKHLGK